MAEYPCALETSKNGWHRVAKLTEFDEGWAKFRVDDIRMSLPREHEHRVVTSLYALEENVPDAYSPWDLFILVPLTDGEFSAAEPPAKVTSDGEFANDERIVGLRHDSELDAQYHQIRENLREERDTTRRREETTVRLSEL